MRWLQLHALARGDRHQALARVRDALAAAGGWVLDVHLYSDMSACLRVSLPAGGGEAFAADLAASEVTLDAASLEALAALAHQPPDDELLGTLELTFAAGTGNLRHDVPAVPG